jgi:diguanylate cyclase (GGDEF)-like protein/PAS domain S-box-containing protein
MSGSSYVILAFFLAAGFTLSSGLQSLLTGAAGRDRPMHYAFAALCLVICGLQLSTAAYYLAPNVDAAIVAVHWQAACLAGLIGPYFLFVARQAGQQRVWPWFFLCLADAAALVTIDQLAPLGARFASLVPSGPLVLPWGEELGHVTGRTGKATWYPFLASFLVLMAWSAARALRAYRAGERRLAMDIALYVAALLASAAWGAAVDRGSIRSFHIGGLLFLVILLLMKLGLARQQAQTLVDLRTERDRLRALQARLEETMDELRGERDRMDETRAQLEASELRMRLVLMGANDAWWDWHVESGTQYYSPRGWEMLGYADQELPYDDALWARLIEPEDRAYGQGMINDAIARGDTNYRFELRMRHKDGHAVPVLCRGYILRDSSGRAIRVTGTDQDLSAQKESESRTHRLAYFDELTSLPNRRLLLDRLGHALDAARRAGQHGALVFLDLDNFKHLNDARGHAMGDRLLVEVSTRLTGILRADDTVARLGGDEFVIVANHLGPDLETAAHAAMVLAEKVRGVLERPYAIDGYLYSSTGSIGLTIFPKPGDAVDNLLREADTAMYRAKAAGRNRVAYFENAMQVEAEERLALEQDLKEAIETGQFTLHVQPQVDAAHNEVGGELLLRWTHPRRGPVSPAAFIPVAEESGLIHKLGDFVLRQACETLVRMQREGTLLPLSVNISPRQFRRDDFVASTRAVLAQTGAPGTHLTLEVTEGLLVEDWEDAAERMLELTRLGLRFSIDDFGTGYSSLAYLKRLPLHEIKIDKTFVQNTPVDANDRAIVKSILAVARAFRLRVVAEGVETRAQADYLARQHCGFFQGYLFARPMPLETWVQQRAQSLIGH